MGYKKNTLRTNTVTAKNWIHTGVFNSATHLLQYDDAKLGLDVNIDKRHPFFAQCV